jgi:hypothetical protein
MRRAFSGPVQLPQAAAKRFDLLLVGVLLPLGQFQCLQHFLHLVQGGPEGLDDVVDFFDGLFNRRRWGGLWLAGWQRGNLRFDRERFGNGLNRFSRLGRGRGRLLG